MHKMKTIFAIDIFMLRHIQAKIAFKYYVWTTMYLMSIFNNRPRE